MEDNNVCSVITEMVFNILEHYGVGTATYRDGSYVVGVNKYLSVEEFKTLLKRIRALEHTAGIDIIVEEY